MGREKYIVLIVSLVLLSAVTFLRSNYLNTTIVDDAYIFFRFAENISSGHGIVWNIGETQVEGYSSFLYLCLILVGNLFSLNPELFSILLGIICSSLHLYLSYLIYNHFFPNLKLENLFTVAIIGLSPAYVYWSSAGMETSFYSMSFLLIIYLFLTFRNTHKLIILKGVMFGLLSLVRYEAILVVLLVTLYFMYKKEDKYIFKITKSSIFFCIGFLIIFTPYFLWKWNYFDYPLPNTFYDKTGGGIEQITGGFLYLIRSFRLFYGLFWIIIGIVLTNFRLNMLSIKARFLVGLSIISVITTIILGGDHFSYGRFFIPVLPFLFITIPPALNKFSEFKLFAGLSKFKLIFLILIFVFIMAFKLPYIQAFKGYQNIQSSKKDLVTVYETNLKENIVEWQQGYAIMGKTLKTIARKNEYIAAIPVGIIGYYSKLNVIDMVGVVDPVIAHQNFSSEYLKQWIPGHNKGDGKYILSRNPDYIQLTDYLTQNPKRLPDNRAMQFKSVKEIWLSEEFHSNYKFYPIKTADGWYYNLFKRIKN